MIVNREKNNKNKYIEKISKNGRLVRTAEQFSWGVWLVQDYTSNNFATTFFYTENEFKKVKELFFND